MTMRKVKLTIEKEIDGRVTRGERNRQALLDAAFDIIKEGNLSPSSQEVAERAGVGLRGIFRHFGGMEGLRAALDERTTALGATQFAGGDRQGSFGERLRSAVELHAAAYEENGNFFRAMQVNRWNSEVLRESYKRDNRRLRKDLSDWLPELCSLPPSRREAVDCVSSFETWQRLREHQHQSVEVSVDIVCDMIKVLVEAPWSKF